MLFAGGCTTATSVNNGAFTFAVSDLPLLTVWNLGSAIIKFDMLLAGGGADSDIFVGPFTFGIHVIPLFGHPFHGSASKITMDKQIQPLINLENTSVRSMHQSFEERERFRI